MGRDVFFSISSHGYEAPKDGFGMKGKVLHPESGKSAEIRLKRLNIAERLYRITGGGIYRDSLLLGEKVPLKEPLLNGQVFGQDSVQPVLYQDKIYWFWGDTNRPSYPLGNFHTTGGWSDRPGHGGLDPAVGVDIRYFTESPDGFVKAMCPFEENGVLVWIDGLLTLPDESGQTRLVTHYTSLKSMAQILEHGLAVWNDEKEIFEKKIKFDLEKRWQCPQSHPIRLTTDGTNYYYFQMPFHTIRMRADWAAMLDQSAYEAFTPLAPGTRYEKKGRPASNATPKAARCGGGNATRNRSQPSRRRNSSTPASCDRTKRTSSRKTSKMARWSGCTPERSNGTHTGRNGSSSRSSMTGNRRFWEKCGTRKPIRPKAPGLGPAGL
jgi:hypothetical protein